MTLKQLKNGDYFTLLNIREPRESQVYIKGDYDRSEKKYCCGIFSDISRYRMLKPTTIVYTDFTF